MGMIHSFVMGTQTRLVSEKNKFQFESKHQGRIGLAPEGMGNKSDFLIELLNVLFERERRHVEICLQEAAPIIY